MSAHNKPICSSNGNLLLTQTHFRKAGISVPQDFSNTLNKTTREGIHIIQITGKIATIENLLFLTCERKNNIKVIRIEIIINPGPVKSRYFIENAPFLIRRNWKM